MTYSSSLLMDRPRYGNTEPSLADALPWTFLPTGDQQYRLVPSNPVGEPLQIHSASYGDCTLAQLVGELDVLTSGLAYTTLHVLLAEQKGSRLVLDLGNLTFADACGLRALFSAGENAAKNGGWVRLARVSEWMWRVLKIVDPTNGLPVYETVAGAIADDAASTR
jgi:anti-sigma B factor antagonist